MDQIAIAITGATAIWLSQDERYEWRKWTCIFGVCEQPFGFTQHGQQDNGVFLH